MFEKVLEIITRLFSGKTYLEQGLRKRGLYDCRLKRGPYGLLYFMIAAYLLIQYLNTAPVNPTPESKAGVYDLRPSSSSCVKVNALRCDSYVRALSPFLYYVE